MTADRARGPHHPRRRQGRGCHRRLVLATPRSPRPATCSKPMARSSTVRTISTRRATIFPACGGCRSLAAPLRRRTRRSRWQTVLPAPARGQGLDPGQVAPPHLSPPATRRRATLHAQAIGKRVVIGFRRGPGLHTALPTRANASSWPPRACSPCCATAQAAGNARRARSLSVDIGARRSPIRDRRSDSTGLKMEGLAETEALLDFARDNGIRGGSRSIRATDPRTWAGARTRDGWSRSAAYQSACRPCAFLRGNRLTARRRWSKPREEPSAGRIGDGCRSFLPASARSPSVVAVAASQDPRLSRPRATPILPARPPRAWKGKPVHALHRDPFRNPLQHEELNRFAAVLLDPPAPARANRCSSWQAQPYRSSSISAVTPPVGPRMP